MALLSYKHFTTKDCLITSLLALFPSVSVVNESGIHNETNEQTLLKINAEIVILDIKAQQARWRSD